MPKDKHANFTKTNWFDNKEYLLLGIHNTRLFSYYCTTLAKLTLLSEIYA
jgi:hypothetical protein